MGTEQEWFEIAHWLITVGGDVLDPLIHAALLSAVHGHLHTSPVQRLIQCPSAVEPVQLSHTTLHDDIRVSIMERIGMLCRFFDVESLEDMQTIMSVESLKLELESCIQKRIELLADIENKLMYSVEQLTQVVQHHTLGKNRDRHFARADTMLKSSQLLTAVVRRLEAKANLKVNHNPIVQQQLLQRLQERQRYLQILEQKYEAIQLRNSNPRFEEIKRRYQQVQDRIQALKF